VLNLGVPASQTIHSERDLWNALVALAPRIIAYLMSFLTLGIFWVGQQTQLNSLARSDRDLTWMHLGFLLAVTLMPFSTGLLAEFIKYRTALIVYWLNILLLGVMIFASWRYGWRRQLVKDSETAEMNAAIERRVVAQTLYALGALLCVFSTYISITVIVLVQLNYVFAPRIRPQYRL
jgi:uncharacterized membrane protein